MEFGSFVERRESGKQRKENEYSERKHEQRPGSRAGCTLPVRFRFLRLMRTI